jgi:hypothetical protein
MNRVEWELYGETNSDQVVDKTNKDLSGIEKNAKRVENAFSMSVSTIFLRFLGPMALLQAAISWISGALEASKAQAAEAQALAEKGESKYVKATTSYLASKYAAEDKDKKEKELAAQSDAESTKRYIEENGMKVMNKMGVMGWLKYATATTGYASKQEDVQKAVAELAAEEMKKSKITDIKKTDFKGPEGFGSVIGVGANPVLETVTQQLEVQRRMLEELEKANQAKDPDSDFTKEQNRIRRKANTMW